MSRPVLKCYEIDFDGPQGAPPVPKTLPPGPYEELNEVRNVPRGSYSGADKVSEVRNGSKGSFPSYPIADKLPEFKPMSKLNFPSYSGVEKLPEIRPISKPSYSNYASIDESSDIKSIPKPNFSTHPNINKLPEIKPVSKGNFSNYQSINEFSEIKSVPKPNFSSYPGIDKLPEIKPMSKPTFSNYQSIDELSEVKSAPKPNFSNYPTIDKLPEIKPIQKSNFSNYQSIDELQDSKPIPKPNFSNYPTAKPLVVTPAVSQVAVSKPVTLMSESKSVPGLPPWKSSITQSTPKILPLPSSKLSNSNNNNYAPKSGYSTSPCYPLYHNSGKSSYQNQSPSMNSYPTPNANQTLMIEEIVPLDNLGTLERKKEPISKPWYSSSLDSSQISNSSTLPRSFPRPPAPPGNAPNFAWEPSAISRSRSFKDPSEKKFFEPYDYDPETVIEVKSDRDPPPKPYRSYTELSFPEPTRSSTELNRLKSSEVHKESSFPKISRSQTELSYPKVSDSYRESRFPELSKTHTEPSFPKISDSYKESRFPEISTSRRESSFPDSSRNHMESSFPRTSGNHKELSFPKVSDSYSKLCFPEPDRSLPNLRSNQSQKSPEEFLRSKTLYEIPKSDFNNNHSEKFIHPSFPQKISYSSATLPGQSIRTNLPKLPEFPGSKFLKGSDFSKEPEFLRGADFPKGADFSEDSDFPRGSKGPEFPRELQKVNDIKPIEMKWRPSSVSYSPERSLNETDVKKNASIVVDERDKNGRRKKLKKLKNIETDWLKSRTLLREFRKEELIDDEFLGESGYDWIFDSNNKYLIFNVRF